MTIRKLLFVSVAALLVVCAADSAFAGTITISSTTDRQGNGGEFKISGYGTPNIPPADVVTDLDGGDFNTFCWEFNEDIKIDGSYNCVVNKVAYGGGVGGGSPDPLDEVTAKLYYTFWTAQWDVADLIDGDFGEDWSELTDYDWDNSSDDETTKDTDRATGRGYWGRALQLALWSLGDEIDLDDYAVDLRNLANKMIDYAENVTWDDLGKENWDEGSIGGVRVLNLYKLSDGSNAQSQLVVVPLPASALMGFAMLASLGLGTIVRKRRRNS